MRGGRLLFFLFCPGWDRQICPLCSMLSMSPHSPTERMLLFRFPPCLAPELFTLFPQAAPLEPICKPLKIGGCSQGKPQCSLKLCCFLPLKIFLAFSSAQPFMKNKTKQKNSVFCCYCLIFTILNNSESWLFFWILCFLYCQKWIWFLFSIYLYDSFIP